MDRKKIAIIALSVIIISTLSLVYADSAGFFTINISNNQNSQLNTNIKNSTVNENMTLNNSTLNLNINSENISSVNINGVNITAEPTLAPISSPTVNVNYIGMNVAPNMISSLSPDLAENITAFDIGNSYNYYMFNVTVVPSTILQNITLGTFSTSAGVIVSSLYDQSSLFVGVGTEPINQMFINLDSLALKYNLCTISQPVLGNGWQLVNGTWYNPVNDTIVTSTQPFYTYQYIGNGGFYFVLYSNQVLTSQQTASLAQDLQSIFQAEVNY